jgi:hypothetical protein
LNPFSSKAESTPEIKDVIEAAGSKAGQDWEHAMQGSIDALRAEADEAAQVHMYTLSYPVPCNLCMIMWSSSFLEAGVFFDHPLHVIPNLRPSISHSPFSIPKSSTLNQERDLERAYTLNPKPKSSTRRETWSVPTP